MLPEFGLAFLHDVLSFVVSLLSSYDGVFSVFCVHSTCLYSCIITCLGFIPKVCIFYNKQVLVHHFDDLFLLFYSHCCYVVRITHDQSNNVVGNCNSYLDLSQYIYWACIMFRTEADILH